MNKEKQIEEMTRVLCEDCARDVAPCTLTKSGRMCDSVREQAEALYNAGYRKASEVVWEIFDKVDEIAYRYLNDADYSGGDMVYDLYELKKKYTEDTE